MVALSLLVITVVVVAVVCLNLWDDKRRETETAEEREEHDRDVGEGW